MKNRDLYKILNNNTGLDEWDNLRTQFEEFNNHTRLGNTELNANRMDLSSDSYNSVIKLMNNPTERVSVNNSNIVLVNNGGSLLYEDTNIPKPQTISNFNIYRQAVINYLMTPKGALANNRDFGNRMIEMIGQKRTIVVDYFKEMLQEIQSHCGVTVDFNNSTAKMTSNNTCTYVIYYTINIDETNTIQNLTMDYSIE